MFSTWLSSLPVELVSCLELGTGCLLMFIMIYFWEFSGACVYIAVATIVANIEVLKGVRFFFLNDPVALGNVVFGTVSIAIAVVNELYGAKKAKNCVSLGFIAIFSFTIFMLFAIGYKPVHAVPRNLFYLSENHVHIKRLFSPSFGVAMASLLAFFFSGRVEILFLSILRSVFKSTARTDFLRMFIASNMAILVDLFLMNYLAWILFAGHPMGIITLFKVYILSSYLGRLLVALMTYPMVFFCRMVCLKSN